MPTGTHDPDRAQRIAAGALEVVSLKGVEGLSYRRVAAVAGVPLGSVTYHYKTLDDLLEAAMRVAKAQTDAEFELLSKTIASDGDVVGHLARYLVETTTRHQGRTFVEFELYLAALRRPQLRYLSRAWGDAMPTMLTAHFPRDIAASMAVTVDGILLKSVVQGFPLPESETRNLLSRSVTRTAPAE